ncbi:sigma-54-dependent transcriptional regulator, partial [Xanthomonas translucens]
MARILIVDDDTAFLSTLQATLRSFGHEVIAAADGQAGLARLRAGGIDLAFVDFRMPGMDGIALMRARQDDAQAAAVPLVMLTAYASSSNTIEAMKLGAFDHLVKPVGRADIVAVVERALQAPAGAASAPPALAAPAEEAGALLGHSAAMRTVHKRIGLAAASDLPVLVSGETGTGKELVARALHRASARAGAAFVAVNCAAIPAELIESELFGYRKGAFSGAVADRAGLIREADGGTLFLDEIGDMPLPMQAKLLRFLQEGEVSPLGGRGAQKVDVRVVAATHRELAQLVADGRFRSDLRYRLNVVPIELPPLRERGDDIVLLAQHFLEDGA